MTVKPKFTNFA